ncbi:MAG: leucine-rich repeat domain-containing protein [bacterium]|nr:leucine-rich repeat domain-containing protein [bacterium]
MATTVVFFADSSLEAAVRQAVGVYFGPLTRMDLLPMRSLDARGLEIRNLSGLEYCSGLQTIDLSDNDITNITPLANLTGITSLNLDNNALYDIGPLAGLRNLQALTLCGNSIADIQPLVTNAVTGGLGPGDYVALDFGALDEDAETVDVPFLESVGVNVVECSG